MSESYECAFCQRQRPQDAFQGRHRRKCELEKPACCTECRGVIDSLRRQAISASASCNGPNCSDGVTQENYSFFEEAMRGLINKSHSDCTNDGSNAWLPAMLCRWLCKRWDMINEAAAIEHVVNSDPIPAWLEELRSERIVKYDASEFPFEQIFGDMFETEDLASLHLQELRSDRPPLCPTLFRAYVNAGIKRPRSWRRKTKWESKYVKHFRESHSYRRFLDVYHRFMKEVIVPMLDCGELIYQCPPTLRCQMPSSIPMGTPHRDSDYAAHHGAEVNFWIPVTRVWGSNSLYIESQPQKADFHPLELCCGEMAIFNGSHCLHYTEANKTDAVRVSFDFRVLPRSLLGNECPRLALRRHNNPGAATYQYEYISTDAQPGSEDGGYID